MQLALDASSPHRRFAPTATSAFPAVSADGKLLVELFAQDLAGGPVTTVVFWSRAGRRLTSYRLGGVRPLGAPADDATPARWTAFEEQQLRRANAQLATTAWRPLALHTSCAGSEDGLTSLRVDGDVALAFDANTQRLTRSDDGTTPTTLRVRFPAPGRRRSGRCGTITGVARAFGGLDLGLAIVVPTTYAEAGCTANLDADLATALPLN
jgi:hypothetical protein